MTDRLAGNHRTTTHLQDTIRWVNTAGASIPAYAVVQFRANYASNFSQASKPNGSAGLFYVNGSTPVAISKYGESRVWSRPQLVLLDGSPTVGDMVGPVSGQWYMSSAGTGFCVIHQAVDGVGSVVQVGGGSSQVCWGNLAADSGPDDVLVSMSLYSSAKPTTYASNTCGPETFVHMRWTLCGESLGTSLVSVPAFYKAGVVGLIKFPDCDPGTGTGGGAQQAWEGWCVVFGDRARCSVKVPYEVLCCPVEGIKITKWHVPRYIGDLGDDILDPCA